MLCKRPERAECPSLSYNDVIIGQWGTRLWGERWLFRCSISTMKFLLWRRRMAGPTCVGCGLRDGSMAKDAGELRYVAAWRMDLAYGRGYWGYTACRSKANALGAWPRTSKLCDVSQRNGCSWGILRRRLKLYDVSQLLYCATRIARDAETLRGNSTIYRSVT